MHFVFHQVDQLQDVQVADGDLLVESLAGAAVVQLYAAVIVRQVFLAHALGFKVVLGELHHLDDAGLFGAGVLLDVGKDVVDGYFAAFLAVGLLPVVPVELIVFGRAVEHGAVHLGVQLLAGPAEHGLEDLADVHAGGHAQRGQHYVHRGTVGHIRHVFAGQDAGHYALVAVAAGELVAHLQAALKGDVHAHHFVDGDGQLAGGLQHFLLAGELFLDALLHLLAELFGLGAFLGGFLAELPEGVEVHVHFRVYLFLAAVFLGAGQLLAAHENAGADDLAVHAGGHAHGGVGHVLGLLAEDDLQQALFGGELLLALRGHFADQDVAGADHGRRYNYAVVVDMLQGVGADVRDVAGDLFGAQLSVAGLDFELLDEDRGESVLFHDLLGDQDGVFVVEAFPAHEGHEQVLAQRELAFAGGGAVGDDIAFLYLVAALHYGHLIHAGVLVGAAVLDEVINIRLFGMLRLNGYHVGGGVDDLAGGARGDAGAGVAGDGRLHAGAYERGLGDEQRHGLPHHVRAHQGAVGVVMLEERDQRGGDGHHLHRRHVHIGDVFGIHEHVFVLDAAVHAVGGELVVLYRGVGLAHEDIVFDVGRDVFGLVRHFFAGDLPVGRLDEAVLVDLRVGGQGNDKTDVRAFGRFDGADAAVMGVVHVADFEAGALPVQTAWSEGRQAALVGQLGQRVDLVHELGELGRTEELPHDGHHGGGVHQGPGGDGLVFLAHAVAHIAGDLHKGHADLVLEQFADGADAAVAEVVDVVHLVLEFLALVVVAGGAGVQRHQVLYGDQDVFKVDIAELVGRHFEALVLLRELLVDGAELPHGLVAAHDGEVVAAQALEHDIVEVFLGLFLNDEVLAAHLLVDLVAGVGSALGLVLGLQRQYHARIVFLGVALYEQHFGDLMVRHDLESFLVERNRGFLFQVPQDFAGGFVHDILYGVLADEIGGVLLVHRHFHALVEGLQDLGVGLEAGGFHEGGGEDLFLAVQADPQHVVGVEFKFHPGAAVRYDAGVKEGFTEDRLLLLFVFLEDDAGRAVQLADHDALGAVEDERAGIGHDGQLAQDDVLVDHVLELAAVLLEAQGHISLERGGVGAAAGKRFFRTLVLGSAELVFKEIHDHRAVGGFDGEHVHKRGLEALYFAVFGFFVQLEEPFERLLLHVKEVGYFENLADLGEVKLFHQVTSLSGTV